MPGSIHMDTFYQTVAQLSFTLLGLWWIVVQTKHDVWIRDPLRRRTATNVSLYFLLPGSMSLFAILSVEAPALWRLAFFVAGVLGAIEAAKLLLRAGFGGQAAGSFVWQICAVALYSLIALIALVPQLALLFGFAPLVVAGLLLSLLVVLGVSLAWAYFIEPLP